MDDHRIWGGDPCATQQVPGDPSLHIPQCAPANPQPPVRPSLPPVPMGNHKVLKVYSIFGKVRPLNLRPEGREQRSRPFCAFKKGVGGW